MLVSQTADVPACFWTIFPLLVVAVLFLELASASIFTLLYSALSHLRTVAYPHMFIERGTEPFVLCRHIRKVELASTRPALLHK
jgi:hypothetical protein